MEYKYGYKNIYIRSIKMNPWTEKSANIPFKSSQKCIGNGEEKVAKELDIQESPGGQNSIVDLVHPDLGKISVKDMTNDDCTLGTQGCQNMRKIFRQIINPFVSWCEKYKGECIYAEGIYSRLHNSYGSSRHTILDGIDRFELCKSNLDKLSEILNEITNEITNFKYENKTSFPSVESEYINDVIINMKNQTLKDLLNNCVRQEAIDMKLIIVYEKTGYIIVDDVTKISCPRITRGAPRIHFN
tara:strand:+ start:5799 stop:6527 length:729 start_codon:yes stop_codon:yes gene_type:complete